MYGDVWIGHDFELYLDATRRWLAGGPFYHPYQLAGPYPIVAQEVLYPPVALWLFVPFTMLPALAWWAPVAIVGAIVWAQRPTPWQRVAILAMLALPVQGGTSWAVDFVVNGNPGMWVAAVVALATRWPFFGSWALLKPSLAPFAFVGINRRAWWLGAATLAVMSLALMPLWADYVVVLRNVQGGGLLYSVPNVTLVLMPLVVPTWRAMQHDLRPADVLARLAPLMRSS
jgi:hypothetical protein